MTAKQREIFKWLEEIFGEHQVPEFDNDEVNIEAIYNLMTSYKETRKDAETVKAFNAEVAKRYEKCAEEKKEILETLKYPELLQSEDRRCLETLISICCELNLESPTATNVIAGINLLEEENAQLDDLLKKEKLRTEKLLKLSRNAAKNLEELESIADRAASAKKLQEEEEQTADRKRNFYEEKIKKYNSDILKLETRLNHVGFSEEISHSSLTKMMQDLTVLEKQLEESKNTFESYTLPPDITLARIEVEKARQQLDVLMQQMAERYKKSS